MSEWLRGELAAIRERARTGAELQGEPGRVLVIADRDLLLEHIHDLEELLADAGHTLYDHCGCLSDGDLQERIAELVSGYVASARSDARARRP